MPMCWGMTSGGSGGKEAEELPVVMLLADPADVVVVILSTTTASERIVTTSRAGVHRGRRPSVQGPGTQYPWPESRGGAFGREVQRGG
ncbi:MAG: hypothetical protein LUE92_04280 [Clostridiales bacterium]|nr:hypothetical protein [Clostridiales bacterium]